MPAVGPCALLELLVVPFEVCLRSKSRDIYIYIYIYIYIICAPGGLVGGRRAYQDQLSHRVHARRGFFLA